MESMDIRDTLLKNGLKITPQRIVVMEALHKLKDHPTTECIIDFIKQNHPNIATGTIYKILETFVEKKIIQKVKTDKDIMRYDAVKENHHHLYCAKSDRIEDFFDEDLDQLIAQYFEKKKIKDFRIDEIKLQILGVFNEKRKNQ